MNPVAHQSAAPMAMPPAARVSQRVFWPVFWAALVLVAAKWFTVRDVGEVERARGWDLVEHLLAVTWQDVAWALGLGLVGAGLLSLSRSRPKVQRAVWYIFLGLCGLTVLYGIGSIFIFQVLRSPLTYALLYMAGDMAEMGSSIGAYVTPARLLLLVTLPVVVVALSLVSIWRLRPVRHRIWNGALAGVLVVAVAWVAWGRVVSLQHPWDTSDDRRVIESPHWALVGSYLVEWAGKGGVRLAEEYPAEFLVDFRTVEERGIRSGSPREGKRPKNAILIVLESVGTRYLSMYGAPFDAMPKLREEMQHAAVFDNCYSHIQNTSNALVALNLSIYPGVSWRSICQEHPRIAGTTLAGHLKGRGYRTMYATSADNRFMNMGGFLEDRGFDHVWDAQNITSEPRLFSWGVEDRHLFDKLIGFIEQEPGKPFFAMGWTIQNHHPYELSPGQDEVDFFPQDPEPFNAWDLNRYLNVLREVDRQLARLFGALREKGIAEDTVVIITGDHGESFGEPHGTWVHAGKVYEEDVAVPLIIWNPGMPEAGKRFETVSGHIDINPTICDLMGMEMPGTWQGWSVFDARRPARAYVYGPTEHLLGVRQGDWKYIYNATRGTEELYNLADDPDEQNNRAKERGEYCAEMRKRLAAWVEYEQGKMKKLQGR